mgnify:FL=1
MTENTKTTIKDYLKTNKIITDGSFGTYFADKYETQSLPELYNFEPEGAQKIIDIHKEYIEAGARLIRTNTFASNTFMLEADFDKVAENIKNAIDSAKTATEGTDVFIAGDIGPIQADLCLDLSEIEQEYYDIVRQFVENGIDIITFETFPDLEHIVPAITRIKAEKDIFVMVQFSMNQYGYTKAGISARKLLLMAADIPGIDAVGFNCGVGPGHMEQIMSGLLQDSEVMTALKDKYIISLPNSGYPERIRNHITFAKHPEYFVDKLDELVSKGADIVGGCCGTTPDFIRLLTEKTDTVQKGRTDFAGSSEAEEVKPVNKAFFADKLKTGEKLIAVELAPPLNANDANVLKGAHMLKELGVDVLTFPDSPSGRTRVDSVLMAEKVHRETGMCVMPHICCRDKNAIAMRSVFLGAHINDIHNFLIITGDPVPSVSRSSVKAVFNFDSVGLMNIARDMNDENFKECPLVYGGSINQGRRNIEVEIGRVKKKMEAGAQFFLTQPVFTKEDGDRLRRFKEETGARILCGIMPLISRKNACFMKNEIAGVNVTEEIVARYQENASREEGEAVGIEIAKEIIAYTDDFVDGYYFSFPFNRVYMLEKILK